VRSARRSHAPGRCAAKSRYGPWGRRAPRPQSWPQSTLGRVTCTVHALAACTDIAQRGQAAEGSHPLSLAATTPRSGVPFGPYPCKSLSARKEEGVQLRASLAPAHLLGSSVWQACHGDAAARSEGRVRASRALSQPRGVRGSASGRALITPARGRCRIAVIILFWGCERKMNSLGYGTWLKECGLPSRARATRASSRSATR
jgi:hypothetical protein